MSTKLSEHFPVSKIFQSGLAKLEFANPVCSMVPDQEKVRVGLTTSVFSSLLSRSQLLGGRCQLACGVDYDPDSRGIFLKDPYLEQFQLDRMPPNWTNGARGVANLVGKEFIERKPISTESGGVRLKFGI